MNRITRHRRDAQPGGSGRSVPNRGPSRPVALLTVGSVVAALGVTAIVGTTQSSAAAAPQWQTLTRTSADAFIETIGVNTHMGYTDTTYNDTEGNIKYLKDLGVRHIRDGASATNIPLHRGLQLASDNGIKASVIVDPAGRYGNGALPEVIAALKDPNKLGGTFATIEGPNELDCTGDGWLERVKSQQASLAKALDAEPSLRDVTLLGPSWCRGDSQQKYGASGSASDALNDHPYPGGAPPESKKAQFDGVRATDPGKPLYATEAGYHNAVVGDGYGHNPTSEKATAPYILRTYLENARLGLKRTFIYELRNQRANPERDNRELQFGLVRYDGSTTPAYGALKNMIATLADPGSKVSDSQVKVGLSDAPDDIRTMALGRADGSTDLVLWRAVSIWDQNISVKKDIAVPDMPVGVTLEQAASASVVKPVSGTQRTSLGSGTSFTVDVGPNPVIVRLSGATQGAPAPSAPATTSVPAPSAPATTSVPAPSAPATTSAPATPAPVVTPAPATTLAPGTASAPAVSIPANAPASVKPAPATVAAKPARPVPPPATSAPVTAPPAGATKPPTRVMNVGDVLRVDVGSTAPVRSGSRTWSPDEGFVGGTTGTARKPVRMTSYKEVYSTYRWGMSSFTVCVPNGRYRVNLLMAEDAFSRNDQRVFTVAAEGQQVVKDMDLFDVAGMHTGVWRSFDTTVADGCLDLGFTADVDNAILAGLQISRRS